MNHGTLRLKLAAWVMLVKCDKLLVAPGCLIITREGRMFLDKARLRLDRIEARGVHGDDQPTTVNIQDNGPVMGHATWL